MIEFIQCFIGVGAPAAGGKPRWTAHTAPDGRTYYYNRETKKSVWSKPPDFDTPAAAAEVCDHTCCAGLEPCCGCLDEALSILLRLRLGELLQGNTRMP